jgi:outer membrane protein OmpA-like peptidoglycan-associated protein
MFSSDKDDSQSAAFIILFAVVTAVVALAIGMGIYKTHSAKRQAAPAVQEVQEVLDGASVKVENGVVKFYFATAKADVAQGASEALAEVVKLAGEGKSLRISGFHDATGDQAKNEELAKLRAFAVRELLVGLGVAQDKIELVKPEALTGSGSNAEARRVEVAALP